MSSEARDQGAAEDSRVTTTAPLVAIVGPTAAGKSELGMHLARVFGGEIVNYDSVQIFRGFDIASAKPSLEDRRQIPHHLIDVRDPGESFSAGDYQREARAVLEDLRARHRLPILVGGTGLYLRALIEGLFDGPQRSGEWRRRFQELADRRGREYVHRILSRLDPETALRIANRDLQKVIRALEVRFVTGKRMSDHLAYEARRPLKGFNPVFVGVAPKRSELYDRIDRRVVRMFESGLVDEVRNALARGVTRDAKPFEALGYRQALGFVEGTMRLGEAIELTQRGTRRYAKRQMTWFRRQPGVTWFEGAGETHEIKTRTQTYLESLLTFWEH